LHINIICVSTLASSLFFQAEDGIRDFHVTGVQTCALPIFIPVVPLNAREEHIPEAAALREEHDSLIGVRIQVAGQHPQEAVELLQRRMKQLRGEPDMVALLLDTEYLASEEVQQRRAAQCA